VMEYSPKNGWHNAKIEAFHNFSFSPATMVFHYGQEIFEGMKAFAYKDGKVAMFRPMENLIRLNSSAERLCMPKIDADFVFKALCELVKLERGWVPAKKETSLYIRPAMIGTDPIIKVRSSDNFLFYMILSPVGPYFSSGSKLSKIQVEDNYVRASKGGMGFAKTGGNYAASIKAGMEAAKKGYDQVLWLDAEERKFAEEVGSMNIFFVIKDTLVTPALNGTILPGVTRKSVIELAKHLKIKVEERKVAITEVIEGLQNGSVSEVFGTGTACVVSPVGTLGYKGSNFAVGNGEIGKYSSILYDDLTGIQYGQKDDLFSWMTVL
ncbi:MAG: branched-chain amino acid aminotransferase, partial [Deltaproteobacteria bacterium]|nr:branched-chain amino acid aminotransferase [Deltaproteobacteria bacterium]